MVQHRERRTIETMIVIYCRAQHDGGNELCDECRELRDYAIARLEKCTFGDEKPVCAKCPIHCYRPAMRERIREVMRFAGPRMAVRHPALALAHMIQKRRPAPERPGTAGPSRRHSRPAGDVSAECTGCENVHKHPEKELP